MTSRSIFDISAGELVPISANAQSPVHEGAAPATRPESALRGRARVADFFRRVNAAAKPSEIKRLSAESILSAASEADLAGLHGRLKTQVAFEIANRRREASGQVTALHATPPDLGKAPKLTGRDRMRLAFDLAEVERKLAAISTDNRS